MQQFISMRVTACRPCGRQLIRSYTGKTLWQGWWGYISFFFNWFVLMANAWGWTRLSRIESPSLSGTLITDAPRGFGYREQGTNPAAEQPKQKRSRLRKAALVLGLVTIGAFVLIGLALGGQHDHPGGHGAPATAPMVERAMAGKVYTSDNGGRDVVNQASCTGHGKAADGAAGLYTHFECQVAFGDGTNEEVLVHILVDNTFFFMKTTAGY
jgi:hypothetical protein